MNRHFAANNIMEDIGFTLMPVPMASATMDGCMEAGRDMMQGGAKDNATGTAILRLGSVVDSLSAVKYVVFDKKPCGAKE